MSCFQSAFNRFPVTLACALAVLLAVTSTALAQQRFASTAHGQGGERFTSPHELLAWISVYREEPAPEKVPEAIKAMSRLGVFRDLERAGVYLGFYAGVLGVNQVKAPDLIAMSFPLRPEDQVVVIRGIVDSGLPEWKELLGKFTERMPARQILIREYLYGDKKPLSAIPLEMGPEVLDAWWGYYFATGTYDPILRIIPALAWVDEDTNLERLTIAGMATWTLATNASRDKPLLDFLRAETYRQPKQISDALRKIVSAAERFEVTPLRKRALEKIELLRAKGPPKKRGWAWWSDAAGTAIALGCVVAGATGQVALGLPCIIGGALSTAASRAIRLQERKQ